MQGQSSFLSTRREPITASEVPIPRAQDTRVRVKQLDAKRLSEDILPQETVALEYAGPTELREASFECGVTAPVLPAGARLLIANDVN